MFIIAYYYIPGLYEQLIVMSIVSQLSSYLPCDLQWRILTEYTKTFILPELLENTMLSKLTNLCDAHHLCSVAIDDYVDKVSCVHDTDVIYFNVCMDTLEDRILDDEWFPFDSSQHTLRVLYLTKTYIQHTHLLKIEIKMQLLNNIHSIWHVHSLCSNINMLTRMIS